MSTRRIHPQGAVRTRCVSTDVRRASRDNRSLFKETTASLAEAVQQNEEVVPVNALPTWVLPSGVTVGR